jgi:hypothetical protein
MVENIPDDNYYKAIAYAVMRESLQARKDPFGKDFETYGSKLTQIISCKVTEIAEDYKSFNNDFQELTFKAEVMSQCAAILQEAIERREEDGETNAE